MAESGTVKWFHNGKGFGFLIRESGEEVFVHHTTIIGQDGFCTLEEGDDVEFEVKEGVKGPHAENVRRIE